MKRNHGWIGALAIFTFAGVMTASAASFTGNPVADGWTLQGTSLNSGTYIRGDAGLSFDVYSDSFTISSNFGPFEAGDVLLGLGGVNNSGFILGPRIVAKFGAAGADFSASSIATPNGNGNGSFPLNSGIGGIEVAFWYQYSGNDLSSSSDNGGIRYPNTATNAQDLVLYNVDNAGTTTNLNQFGAVVSQFTHTGGKDVLKSWEAVVDITALADPSRGNFPSIDIPGVGDLSDMALQDTVASAPADFTDALTTIPEPSTWSLVFVSVAAFGLASMRRRSI